MHLQGLLRSFLPHPSPVTFTEKLRSGLAGGVAILVLAVVLRYVLPHDAPLPMLASMAASAVLLFAVPHSPLAQPWNLVGGHVVSAIVGWTCGLVVSDPVIAAGLAVGISIFLMSVSNCLHPPGAATALTLVLNATQFHGMAWTAVAWIVLANITVFLLLGLLLNNVLPHRRYPSPPARPQLAPGAGPVVGLEPPDLAWALGQMDGLIDIDLADLGAIYEKALHHARQRGAGASKGA